MSAEQLSESEIRLSILQGEQQMLRTELNQLKGCQLQYFTLSVTGSAALFGLAATRSDAGFLSVAFLAPLAIVLPCWWIFFDKATTITRIVGYYRVIERMLGEHPKLKTPYIGYERALALYRKEEDGDGRRRMEACPVVQQLRMLHKSGSNDKTAAATPPEIRHRYWQINFWTYSALSFFCCVLSIAYLLDRKAQPWLMVFPLVGFVVTFLFFWLTRRILMSVTLKQYSYNENHYFWEYIHSPECMKTGELEERGYKGSSLEKE
jgi:hypothetical protein